MKQTEEKEDLMTLETAQGLAERRIRFIDPEDLALARSRCVDGRYEPSDAAKACFAHPGADAGTLMEIQGAARLLAENGVLKHNSVTTYRAAFVDAVVNAVGRYENLEFHTDDGHIEEEGVALGCGHCAYSKRRPAMYGITEDDCRYRDSQLGYLKRKGAKERILKGKHGEKAVFILLNSNCDLLPRQENDSDVFVYNKERHVEQLGSIARLLGSKQIENRRRLAITSAIWEEALRTTAEKQLNATLRQPNIALGLPVFTVTASPKIVRVNFQGIVGD